MAIKERKQITGTEAQIKDYAGHNGTLAYATDTKHLHVLSGTAGTTTELANRTDIPDITGKADTTYVNAELTKKQNKGDYATTSALTSGLAGKANSSHTHTIANVTGLQDALNAASTQASNAIPKTGDRGPLAGYETVTVESESDVSVTKDTPDVFLTSGAITAPSFSSSEWGECWTKVGALLSTSPLVTLNDHWIWSGGVAPTLHQYDLVVFNKTRGLGTATVVVRG